MNLNRHINSERQDAQNGCCRISIIGFQWSLGPVLRSYTLGNKQNLMVSSYWRSCLWVKRDWIKILSDVTKSVTWTRVSLGRVKKGGSRFLLTLPNPSQRNSFLGYSPFGLVDSISTGYRFKCTGWPESMSKDLHNWIGEVSRETA